MKKLIFVLISFAFLVVTVSMITKNYTNTTKKHNSPEIIVRTDMVLEQRP